MSNVKHNSLWKLEKLLKPKILTLITATPENIDTKLKENIDLHQYFPKSEAIKYGLVADTDYIEVHTGINAEIDSNVNSKVQETLHASGLTLGQLNNNNAIINGETCEDIVRKLHGLGIGISWELRNEIISNRHHTAVNIYRHFFEDDRKRCIIYCQSRDIAKNLVDDYNRQAELTSIPTAQYLDCETSKNDRDIIKKNFQSGANPLLICVKTNLEGYDDPKLDLVFNCRYGTIDSTGRDVETEQMLGRITRAHEDKGIAEFWVFKDPLHLMDTTRLPTISYRENTEKTKSNDPIDDETKQQLREAYVRQLEEEFALRMSIKRQASDGIGNDEEHKNIEINYQPAEVFELEIPNTNAVNVDNNLSNNNSCNEGQSNDTKTEDIVPKNTGSKLTIMQAPLVVTPDRPKKKPPTLKSHPKAPPEKYKSSKKNPTVLKFFGERITFGRYYNYDEEIENIYKVGLIPNTEKPVNDQNDKHKQSLYLTWYNLNLSSETEDMKIVRDILNVNPHWSFGNFSNEKNMFLDECLINNAFLSVEGLSKQQFRVLYSVKENDELLWNKIINTNPQLSNL